MFLTLNTKTFKFRKLPVCIPYDVHRSHLGGDRSEDIQRCTFSSTFFHLEASNIETYLPLQVKDLYIISVLYITESSKRDSYLPILVVAMRSNFHSRKGKPDASSPFYSHADSLPRHHCWHDTHEEYPIYECNNEKQRSSTWLHCSEKYLRRTSWNYQPAFSPVPCVHGFTDDTVHVQTFKHLFFFLMEPLFWFGFCGFLFGWLILFF